MRFVRIPEAKEKLIAAFIVACILAFTTACPPPPAPHLPDESDFEFKSITVSPAGAAESLYVGKGALVSIGFYPAFLVTRIRLEWITACGNALAIDTPTVINALRDSLRMGIALPCPGASKLIVTATMKSGERSSDTIPVFVYGDKPVITGRAEREHVIALGSRFDLWVSAAGSQIPTPFSYVWKHNGIIIENAVDSVYSIVAASLADTGKYICVISNAWGQAVSDTFRVRVETGFAPIIVRTSNKANQVRERDAITFWVSAIGSKPLSYTWKRGERTLGSIDSSFTIGSVAAADSGVYICIVANAAGSASDTFRLIVVSPNAPPAPANLRITAMSSTTVALTWDAMTADSFIIYRKKLADPVYSRIAATSEIAYIDSSAQKGEFYHYVVAAYREGLVSAYSNAVSSLRTPLTPVQNVVAARKAAGSDTIIVSWNPIAGSTAADGIEYHLYAATAKTGAAFSLKYSGSVTSTAVFSSQDLYLYIIARNKYGEASAPSDTVATQAVPDMRPKWAKDTIPLALNEGDSAALHLLAHIANLAWLNPASLVFSLQSAQFGKLNDSVYIVQAGRRQAGAYADTVIVSYGNQADTAVIVVTVEAKTHSLTVSPAVNGRITWTPAGNIHRWGDTITIKATPDNGYRLSEWTGNASGSDTIIIVIMTSNKTVGATFISTSFSCTPVTPGENASITAHLQTAAASTVKPVWICLGEGRYDANTIEVEGKVELWAE